MGPMVSQSREGGTTPPDPPDQPREGGTTPPDPLAWRESADEPAPAASWSTRPARPPDASAVPGRGARTWFDAWVEAAYGADGFWRFHQPDQHFRTAATTTPLLAHMVASLLERRPAVEQVLDLGAGTGSLLAALAGIRPDLALSGVDLRPRPSVLPERVRWAQDCWDVRYGRWTTGELATLLAGADHTTLIVSCEWLDDLPCPLLVQAPDGWRSIVVDDAGQEQPGCRLAGEEAAWADRWWSTGERAEVGLTRDRAWGWAVRTAREQEGCALMIDYGHRAEDRPVRGSFAAHRDGRPVAALPASDLNLTAHVAVDSVRAAGEAAGATTAFCCLQSEVVPELLHPESHPDPLLDLARRSQQAALSSSYVWGSHWWLLQD